MGKLHLEKMVLGMVGTNFYLAVNEETKEALLIDPPDRADLIAAKVAELEIQPVGILLTHGHFDHIGAATETAGRYGIPVLAHEAEVDVLENTGINLSGNFGGGFTVKADRTVRDGEEFTMAGFQIQVFHTPGHTKGGACYYLPEEQVLFSGDTLFCESIGRTDFPTGSMSALVRSARHLTEVLPEETKVYPGHESMTDIAHEKLYNPYLV